MCPSPCPQPPPLVPGPAGKSLLILHGSVTGKAESIAELIAEEADRRDYRVDLHCMSEVNLRKEAWKDRLTGGGGGPVVLVSSTTGDGDQPEKAEPLWRQVKRRTLPADHLAGLTFAHLGLGDSNYSQFCNGPKTLRERLLQLGAVEFYPPGWADDGVGLEIVVEPWIEGLWRALVAITGGLLTSREEPVVEIDMSGEKGEEAGPVAPPVSEEEMEALVENLKGASLADKKSGLLGLEVPEEIAAPQCPDSYLEVAFGEEVKPAGIKELKEQFTKFPLSSTDEVHEAQVAEGVPLTSDHRVKRIYKLTLTLPEAVREDLAAGDAVGIVCPNPAEEVEALLARTGLRDHKDKAVTVSLSENSGKRRAKVPEFLPPGGRCSLMDLLTWHLDIRAVPKKPLVRLLADRTASAPERRVLLHLSSRAGAADYLSAVRGRRLCLLDLLLALPSCRPAAGDLFEHLPRLQARPYSLASAMGEEDGAERADFVFSVEDLDADDDGFRRFPRRGVCTGWMEDMIQAAGNDADKDEGKKVGDLERSGKKHLPALPHAQSLLCPAATFSGNVLNFLARRKKRETGKGDNIEI